MNEAGRRWFERLKNQIGEHRSVRPIIDRQSLSTAEEMQCRIIGGSLIRWLTDYGPELLQERCVLSELMDVEEDPYIIFTSTAPGLVAAGEILQDGPSHIVFLYIEEFDEWLRREPDRDYRWHVHFWSYFDENLNEEISKKAKQYQLKENEQYWLHKEGTRLGPLFGRGADHLWRWNGSEAELLEECIDHWIS